MSRQSLAGVALMKTVTTFYRRLFFVTRQLDTPVPILQSQLEIEMRLMTEQDLEAYLVFRRGQRLDRIRARLAAGHQCHVSWHKGRIVDAAWCATGRGPVPYFGRDLILDPAEVFIYDAYTLPACRRRRLFMAKFAHIFRESHAAGYKRNSGVVAPENRTSLAVMLRLGCEVAGLYSSLGLGPRRRIWRNPYNEQPLPLMAPLSSPGA